MGAYLVGVCAYSGLFYTLPLSKYVLPGLLGLLVGAMTPSRRPLAVTTLAWLTGAALAPPQRIFYECYYFESSYLDIINRFQPDMISTLLGLAVALSVAWLSSLVRWNPTRRTLMAGSVLAIIVTSQLLLVATLGSNLPKLYQTEPANKMYNFDGLLFLKVLHLYRGGHNYYESFHIAMEQDRRSYLPGYPSQSLRPALPFWVLTQLPDLRFVPAFCWLLTALLQVVVFLGSRRLLEPIPSLVGPMLIGAYLAYANTTPFLLIADVAGGELILLSLCLYALVGWRAGFPMMGIAIMVREWAAGYLLVATALAAYRRQKNEALGGFLVLLICLLIYQHHYGLCRSLAGMTGTLPFHYRLNGSLIFALSTLRHGAVFLAGRDIVMPIFSILGVAALWHFRKQPGVVQAIVPCLGLFLVLCRFGDPGFAQYYGFSYVPTVLWGASLTVGALARMPAVDGEQLQVEPNLDLEEPGPG